MWMSYQLFLRVYLETFAHAEARFGLIRERGFVNFLDKTVNMVNSQDFNYFSKFRLIK